jgi:hypothetical protein
MPSARPAAFMYARVVSLTTTRKVVHAIVRVPLVRNLLQPGSRYSLTDPTARAPSNGAPAPRVKRPRGPSYASMLRMLRESAGDRAMFRRKLEQRLSRSGLIQKRRADDDVERVLGSGSIDAPFA